MSEKNVKPKRSRPQPTKFTGSEQSALAEVRQFVFDHRIDAHGASCPACDQLVKIYNRKLNSPMAIVLIYLVRQAQQAGYADWVHVPSFIRSLPLPPGVSAGNGGDWSKLRFWGFIEPKFAEREDGSKRNGYYKVTQKGIDFALGKDTAPASFYMTNQTVIGPGPGEVSVAQALGKKFDYSDLMTSVLPMSAKTFGDRDAARLLGSPPAPVELRRPTILPRSGHGYESHRGPGPDSPHTPDGVFGDGGEYK